MERSRWGASFGASVPPRGQVREQAAQVAKPAGRGKGIGERVRTLHPFLPSLAYLVVTYLIPLPVRSTLVGVAACRTSP